MPFTFRNYRVRQIGLYVKSEAPLATGHERIQEGDIGVVLNPNEGVAGIERAHYLWLRVQGRDDNDMDRLQDNNQPDIDGNVFWDKRRYCIPFKRLKEVYPPLDISSVKDPVDMYQPFLGIDNDNGLFLITRPPLTVFGLVFDKETRRYW